MIGQFKQCESRISNPGVIIYRDAAMIGPLTGTKYEIQLWTLSKPKYDRIFNDLSPVNGKVSGSAAKNEMVKSKLPNSVILNHFRLNPLTAVN